MAITFENTYTEVMDFVNRPTSDAEVLARAKRAINNAVQFLQRERSYTFCNQRETVTLNSGTARFLGSAKLTYQFRQILSVDLVSSSSATFGVPIPLTSLSAIQRERMNWRMSSHASAEADEWTTVATNLGFQSFTEQVYNAICFADGLYFGLYPTQTSDRYLDVHYVAWYPLMSATSDTNPFLDYAYELVCNLAIRELGIYLGKVSDLNYLDGLIKDGLGVLQTFSADLNSYN